MWVHVTASVSWPAGAFPSEDMIDYLCTVANVFLNESKMGSLRTYDFIRPAQLSVRLMKCGKVFSFSAQTDAVYSTIKSFARPCPCARLPSLWASRHWLVHCDWAHRGAITRVRSYFILLQFLYRDVSYVSQLSSLKGNTLSQDSVVVFTVDTVQQRFTYLKNSCWFFSVDWLSFEFLSKVSSSKCR